MELRDRYVHEEDVDAVGEYMEVLLLRGDAASLREFTGAYAVLLMLGASRALAPVTLEWWARALGTDDPGRIPEILRGRIRGLDSD